MATRAAAIRAFVRRHQAAQAAERGRLISAPPSPPWSIAVGLSLLAAVEQSGTIPPGPDPVSESQDAAVREVWRRLRERL